MIIEIPDKDDFVRSGLSMLNLAWDAIAALYLDFEDSKIEDWDDDGDVKEEFWKAAQHPISIALALSQQGIELMLKGRITEVSPFLLLSGSPKDWPSGCGEKNTPFAYFRTIEAHELIRAHDSVFSERLTDAFKTQFEELRRVRNIIFHGVDKRSRPTAKGVFKIILEAVDCLHGPKSWIKIRREYLKNTPRSIAYSTDEVDIILVSEVLNLLKVLNHSDTRQYLGFNKKQRDYICYNCAQNCSDADLKPRSAQLDPNTPDSTQVYCFICDEHRSVIREQCGIDGCLGNVIDSEDMVCLTCYADIPNR